MSIKKIEAGWQVASSSQVRVFRRKLDAASFVGTLDEEDQREARISRLQPRWLVDIQPGGRTGRRVSQTLPTKQEALQWEAWARSNSSKQPGWKPDRLDTRRLTDLVDRWYEAHGKQLKAGKNTYSRLKFLAAGLTNPLASAVTPAMFATYRAKRIENGTSPNAINREHAYLRSVFNELKRLGDWKGDNPLASVRQFRVAETELTYLSKRQIEDLLQSLRDCGNRHAELVARVCLATGLRWTESETLRRDQVRNGQVTVLGKNQKRRSIPIDKKLEAQLTKHHRPEETGDSLFASAYNYFRASVTRIDLRLPKGQLSHVLRHTFASYFMQGGGNILALQRILDHKDLKMTMRYAHLAPQHLEEVKTLNPLSALRIR